MSNHALLAALSVCLPLTALACGDSFQATSGAGGSGGGGSGGSSQSGPGGSGGGTGGSGGGSGGGGAASCDADVHVKSETAYKMAKYDGDAIICYGVDLPLKSKRHIVELTPKIGNPNIVHFVRLWSSEAAYGPAPVMCGDPSKAQLLGVWAPGGGPLTLPAEAGFPLEAGTAHLVVQIHYSNLQHMDGQEDSTGFDLCTTEKLRPNDAGVLAFGTFGINVPAKGQSDITCDITSPAGSPTYTAVYAMPHMHQKGKLLATTIVPDGGGAGIDLGTSNPFEFEKQAWKKLDNVPVKMGDKIRTRCAWTNDTENDVHYGQNTAEENCFDFVTYYPLITNAGFNWATLPFLASCSATPAGT